MDIWINSTRNKNIDQYKNVLSENHLRTTTTTDEELAFILHSPQNQNEWSSQRVANWVFSDK